ncbi:proton-conducting transporter membrane subunit [Escherichia fergusonii]|uniref:proton-conducting transporter transmembrane domain-containing protein n=1 Tax=Escherichia fergusonii TaxID=564 RepID=UPI0035C06FFF
MDALQLLLCSLMLYFFAGIASLFLYGLDRIAIKISGIASLAGGLVGIVSALTQLHSAIPLVTEFITPFPFATLTIRMDSLSAFMLLVISVLVAVCALYSLAYMREYLGKGAAAIGFFMNMFIASMVSLLVMDNAFWFIVFFEMMSLASWFLVIAAQDKESIRAGMLYFFIAHAGSVLIMIAFFLMWRECHSLDFASFRTLPLSPGLASAVFLLGFFGFGAKAGMLPLHSWLPLAHPAAPSHASALMSGVMVKIGIFGILKVSIDLLGNSGLQLWWGVVVIIFGAVSALLGVLYALAENDIKRLLAWSTVENVGIILLGVGVSMIGLSLQLPVIATVGLLVLIRYYVIICQSIGNDFPNKLLLIFGMLSVAVAAFFILVQRDMKRLLAYSSVENMGLVAVALGIGGPLGILAALLHTLNHSLAKTLLFCGSGNVLLKYGTRDLNVIRGMLKIMPFSAVLLGAGALALAGMPPFNIFLSEFMTITAGLARQHLVLTIVLLLLLTLVLAGLVRMAARVLFARPPEAVIRGEISWLTTTPMALLVVMMLMMGTDIPQPIIRILQNASVIVLAGTDESPAQIMSWQDFITTDTASLPESKSER